MMHTVAVLNQKGGVGKTTLTLGLASAAAASGRRVLVVDADPQASSTWVLGLDPEESEVSVADVLEARDPRTPVRRALRHSEWADLGDHVDVLPASSALQHADEGHGRRLRRAIEHVEDGYDAVLIDCPPGLGDLTVTALTAARHALVVVEPSALGLRGIAGVADVIDDVWDSGNPDLELAGVVLNRVPAVSVEAERRIGELARIVGRSSIWRPPIPQRVIVNQALGERRPIHSYGSRAYDTIDAFDRLWTRLRNVLRRG